MDVWFPYGPRWHAVKVSASEVTEGRCGIVLVGPPPPLTERPVDAAFPPDACHACKIEVAMDDAIDEPIEDARARGYEPWRPDPDN